MLLNESINGLAIKPDGAYVDVTFGGGGHSRAILSQLGPGGRLLGMDQDMDAWANRLADDRFTFVHGNFAYLKNFLRRFVTQQFKRSCMPDGVKATEISLSPRGGLAMPSDASFAVWMKELED